MKLDGILQENIFKETDIVLKKSFMELRKSRIYLEESITVLRKEFIRRYYELDKEIKRSRGRMSPTRLKEFHLSYNKTKEGRIELLKQIQDLESSFFGIVDDRSIIDSEDVEEKGYMSFNPEGEGT